MQWILRFSTSTTSGSAYRRIALVKSVAGIRGCRVGLLEGDRFRGRQCQGARVELIAGKGMVGGLGTSRVERVPATRRVYVAEYAGPWPNKINEAVG